MAITYAVFQAAAKLVREKYDMRLLVADEGGLAPPFPNIETMLDDAVAAIRAAGYEPGRDVALCVDVAASHFYEYGRYHLTRHSERSEESRLSKTDGELLTSTEMIETIAGWLDRYPLISVEDGLAEEDWANWPLLRQRIAGRA